MELPRIIVGTDWSQIISEHLFTVDIILLLLSPDFLASNYCYSVEMGEALERHKHGDTRVIPIIIRPTFWVNAPFGKLQALPQNAKPVTSWLDSDEAFANIVGGIEQVCQEIQKSRAYFTE